MRSRTPERLQRAVVAGLAAIFGPVLSRAASTLIWDASPAIPGVQGGAGTWANGGPANWFNGTANVAWNNANVDSAVFGGASGGTVTISGTVAARVLTFDTPGYLLTGGVLNVTGGSGTNFGVFANADVMLASDVLMNGGVDGWFKDGPGTLALAGNNIAAYFMILKAGTTTFAAEQNLPTNVSLRGGTLRYTGGPGDVEIARNVGTTAGIGGTFELPDPLTTLTLRNKVGGAGPFIKAGAGTLVLTGTTTTSFSGSLRVDAGVVRIDQPTAINYRPIVMTGGAVELRYSLSADFKSAVSASSGGSTLDVDRSANATKNDGVISIGGLSTLAGATLNLKGAHGWSVKATSVTNDGTINLGSGALLTVSGTSNAGTGLVRSAVAPAGAGTSIAELARRGVWVSGTGTTTLPWTFAGATDDSELVLGTLGGGTTRIPLTGAWRGGGGSASSFLVMKQTAVVEDSRFVFAPGFRANTITPDLRASRPMSVIGTWLGRASLELGAGFVADHTANGTVDDGLTDLRVTDLLLVTHDSQSLPVAWLRSPAGGAHRAGKLTLSGSNWTVDTNDQTYDGGLEGGGITLNRSLTLSGRATYFDNQFLIPAGPGLSVNGIAGTTFRVTGDVGCAAGSVMVVSGARGVFETDLGAGWYAGNYTRNPDGTVASPPAPSHALTLTVDDAQFLAPVTHVKDLTVNRTAVLGDTTTPSGLISVAHRLTVVQAPDRYLDLGTGAAILKASTYHTLPAVQAMVDARYIRSGAADAAHVVACATAGSVLSPGADRKLWFMGESVGYFDVLVRYTLLGDATLDGTVDFDDLVRVAQNYNRAASSWSQGDFTGDGQVDFNDLVKLAQNYNGSLTGAPPIGLAAPAGFAADAAAAFAAVPEPGAAGPLAALAVGCRLGGRRHRRGKQEPPPRGTGVPGSSGT